MSQGNWGGGPGGGWGGGQPPGGGGYGPPGGGAPPGGGGYGPPPGGGYGQPPGGGGYGAPPGGGGFGQPPGGGGYGAPPGGGGFGGGGGGFAPPPAGYPPGYSPQAGGGVVAWEDSTKGFFGRWWSTVKAVSFDARSFYGAAAQNDNPWPSITFAMSTAGLIGLPVGALFAVFYALFGAMIAAAMSGGGRGAAGGASAVMGASILAGVFMVVLCPLIMAIQALITPWIAAGVDHLMLVLMKGATRSYSHSVRVFGYAWGANFWMIIPGVGMLAAAIFMIIARVVGLDETHKCGIGKAIAAVFLPVVICCACYCGFWMLFGAATAGSGHR